MRQQDTNREKHTERERERERERIEAEVGKRRRYVQGASRVNKFVELSSHGARYGKHSKYAVQ